MTTTPMKSVFALALACSLVTLVACEKDTKDTTKESDQTGKDVQRTGTGAQPGAGQPGAEQPGMKVEQPGERTPGMAQEMGTDAKAALEKAETRLNDLEARITKATADAKASGRELSRELSDAQATAKARAEAARKAAEENLDSAVKDLETAIDDLEKQIKAWDESR